MIPSFCGAIGLARWLIVLLVWVALIVAVVWGVAGLFPGRNEATLPASTGQRHGEDVEAPLADHRSAAPDPDHPAVRR